MTPIVLFLVSRWQQIAAGVLIVLALGTVYAWDKNRLAAAYKQGAADNQLQHERKAIEQAAKAQIEFERQAELRRDLENESQRQARLARSGIDHDTTVRRQRLLNELAKARNSNKPDPATVGPSAQIASAPSGDADADRSCDQAIRSASDQTVKPLIDEFFSLRTVALNCAAQAGVMAEQLQAIEDAQSQK